MSRVVVVGAGIGGLSAALRLARAGCEVTILEARSAPGGLASSETHDGLRFDAGPYALLDRPGLEHAFRELGLSAEALALRRIDDLLELASGDSPVVRLLGDLDATCAEMERTWPGAGNAWRAFVGEMSLRHARLFPNLLRPRPTPLSLLRGGAWRDAPFLMRSLKDVTARHALPEPVRDLVHLWTHVAAQRIDEAPAPLAFVPALVHGHGAWLPERGMGAVAEALAAGCADAGVTLRCGEAVTAIGLAGRRASFVETAADRVACDAVVSNAGGHATLERLLRGPLHPARPLPSLRLQSPGACAYLAVRGIRAGAYLRFRLGGEGVVRCRLLALPSLVAPTLLRDGWAPARLIAPMPHAAAEALGPEGQSRLAASLLDEPWWREHVGDARVLAVRTPSAWGRDFLLHRDSMNPAMTARSMRAGRMPHRVRGVERLYLAGSSTHPGQWVSSCALSGLHAASRVLEDLA